MTIATPLIDRFTAPTRHTALTLSQAQEVAQSIEGFKTIKVKSYLIVAVEANYVDYQLTTNRGDYIMRYGHGTPGIATGINACAPASAVVRRLNALMIACVALGKAQILDDCLRGKFVRIDGDITSFGQLHDVVDANYYGGFCDDEQADAMQEALRDDADGIDEMPSAYNVLCNRVQDEFDAWIRKGGFVAALERVEDGTLSAHDISLAALGLPVNLGAI